MSASTSTAVSRANSVSSANTLDPIEIAGETYEVETATIERAYIGYEDHGFLIAHLLFAGKSWGQGEPPTTRSPEDLDRYLRSVLSVTGTRSWNELPGIPVLTLRRSILGPVEGFARTDRQRIMLFKGGRSEVILQD